MPRAPVLAKPYTIDAIEPALDAGLRPAEAPLPVDDGIRWKRMWLTTFLLAPRPHLPVIAAVLFFAQTALIFPGGQRRARPDRRRPAPSGSSWPRRPATACTASTSRRPSGRRAERLLILGFAGNACERRPTAPNFCTSCSPRRMSSPSTIAAIRRATGETGAAALQEDALLVHDYLRERLQPGAIVAVGFSIGSGVAAYLAGHRPLDGLILVTPFDSLAALAAGHYPWLPVRLLLRHAMEPAEDLRGSPVPVAILPAASTRSCRRRAPRRCAAPFPISSSPDHPRCRPQRHLRDPGFRPAIREALARMSAANTRRKFPSCSIGTDHVRSDFTR